IIIGRGGGSLEDLWAFNEEELAQAVFDARTPVISAVGHETDTVITDYVADLRAPTPSAAAELAVFEYSTLMREISGFQDSLTKEVRRVIRRDAERAGLFRERLNAFSPASRIRDRRMRAAQLEEKLSDVMSALLLDRRHTLQLFAARLAQYSPLHRLSGGYSYVSDAAGAAVVSARQLKKDDRIRIRLRDGEADARVEKIGLLPEEK
ncbi:MAG: exodeoxyribonuclease VII large subunit, partial [Lachnospiraceae bacterium]|nr:exodeoxyribonuclease VII large subunit [Lachnospiraceae bacterium]